MDTPPLTRSDLAAMEAPGDPVAETPRPRSGRVPCLEIGVERSRPLLECRGFAHESGPAEKVVLRSGSDLGIGDGKSAQTLFMNRRIRNRTYGGVRGRGR